MKISTRSFPIEGRWCLHSYYSLCPYAPDGSGRILIAGADPDSGMGEIFVLSPEGEVLNRFGRVCAQPSFWHTGFWQSWSPDSRSIYYQGGSFDEPRIIRHDLATGKEVGIPGEFDGAPPSGEPILSCAHSMLYAAGYGDNRYKPEDSPVPFQARDRHGISRVSLETGNAELVLSTEEILNAHPQRDRILAADQEIRDRLGPNEGLTLMTYCLRWNRAGTRCLFFFGNHCVVKSRGEPKINCIFTASRSLDDVRLVLDLSFGLPGVHWAWQADDEHLIGYGPMPNDPKRICLAEVRYDGSGYRWLSDHRSGGHPSTSPSDPNLIVTDERVDGGGAVVFLSKKTGGEVGRVELPKFVGESEAAGRNPYRICHHPVFNREGDRVLCNSLPGRDAVMVEIGLLG